MCGVSRWLQPLRPKQQITPERIFFTLFGGSNNLTEVNGSENTPEEESPEGKLASSMKRVEAKLRAEGISVEQTSTPGISWLTSRRALELWDAVDALIIAERTFGTLREDAVNSQRISRTEQLIGAVKQRVARLRPSTMTQAGNIDLRAARAVQIPNRSILIDLVRGQVVLIPIVTLDGSWRALSDLEAREEYMQTGQHFGVFENSSDGIDTAHEFTEHIYETFWQQRRWRGTAPFHRPGGEGPWWASLGGTEPFDVDYLDKVSSQERDDYVRQNYKNILKKISQLTTSDRTESDIFPVETWQQWLNNAFHHETDHPVELYKHLQRPVREYVTLHPLVPYMRHVETLLQRGEMDGDEVRQIESKLAQYYTSLDAVLSIMLYHGYSRRTAMEELLRGTRE